GDAVSGARPRSCLVARSEGRARAERGTLLVERARRRGAAGAAHDFTVRLGNRALTRDRDVVRRAVILARVALIGPEIACGTDERERGRAIRNKEEAFHIARSNAESAPTHPPRVLPACWDEPRGVMVTRPRTAVHIAVAAPALGAARRSSSRPRCRRRLP